MEILHPDGAVRALFVRYDTYKAIEMRDKSIPLSIQNLLNEFMDSVKRTQNRIISINENFICLKMEDFICNANVYSAFLEGKSYQG